MSLMRISQLAGRTGVPATTLRYYESAGLLPADRSPSGYRLYGEDAVERLAFVGAARHLGLPLAEIGELLGVWESGACAEVKAELRPRIAARLAEAERRAAELAGFASGLRAALARLDALPDRAGRCDPGCGFLTGPGGTRTSGPVEVALAPSRRAADAEAERWRAAPVACSLSGAAMAERVADWHRALEGARRVAIADGVRLTVPAGRTVRVAELAAAEQDCCAFFDFRLRLDGPDLHLEVRAPAEAAALLTELFAPAA